MGIPSYFSYIIKNHANIIRNRRKLLTVFSSLYMDCNSIIYDCVRSIESDTEQRPRGFNIESAIINAVIAKIEKYVDDIQPSNVVYIAFDGVAPFAKMEQQRIRRHKTGYLSEISRKSKGIVECGEYFNTTAITPGTEFMNLLSLQVKRAFERGLSAKTVVVSGSDEPGEGEHKMFQYMRENAGKDEIIAVYGLDADLIMLSVFHCFSCKNIFIFRESPEFGKAYLEDNFARDECLFLDNRVLAGAILSEMGVNMSDSTESVGRIYDYIFACFLLGNDFLPHFPALNIRTHGNYTILETYRNVIARFADRRFISLSTGNIQWRWVKVFLQELAKNEHEFIRNEYESRHKMEKRYYPTTTHEERTTAFDNIPTLYRAEEHYINPNEFGWECRYYKVALHSFEKSTMDKLCNNYLEGLEWTFKYYTEGCPHWRWKYNYHYPPLIKDLVNYIPNFETAFIDDKKGINKPFRPSTQLAYVIPRWNHSLLPKKIQKHLRQTNYVDLSELKFQWMFCRYFWESHALLPSISLTELETLDEISGKV